MAPALSRSARTSETRLKSAAASWPASSLRRSAWSSLTKLQSGVVGSSSSSSCGVVPWWCGCWAAVQVLVQKPLHPGCCTCQEARCVLPQATKHQHNPPLIGRGLPIPDSAHEGCLNVLAQHLCFLQRLCMCGKGQGRQTRVRHTRRAQQQQQQHQTAARTHRFLPACRPTCSYSACCVGGATDDFALSAAGWSEGRGAAAAGSSASAVRLISGAGAWLGRLVLVSSLDALVLPFESSKQPNPKAPFLNVQLLLSESAFCFPTQQHLRLH